MTDTTNTLFASDAQAERFIAAVDWLTAYFKANDTECAGMVQDEVDAQTVAEYRRLLANEYGQLLALAVDREWAAWILYASELAESEAL